MSDKRYIPELQVHPWQKEIDGFVDVAGYGTPAAGTRWIMTDGADVGKLKWVMTLTTLTLTPAEGWEVWDKDTEAYYYYDGSRWIKKIDTLIEDVVLDSFLIGTAASTMAVKTPAETLAVLSGEAGATFDFNSQQVNVGKLKVGATGDVIEEIVYDSTIKCAIFTFE